MPAPPTTIDHDALWKKTASVLASLSSLRINPLRVKKIANSEVFVGGFGDVEKAELRIWFGSIPVIALKRLRPMRSREQRIRVVASLARELVVWHKLKHPNILLLEGFFFEESSLKTACIITYWQSNGNVLTYLQALDTARGLAYLHSLSPSICHGDIKAENTLVSSAGAALLCDFGLAKVLEAVPSGLTTSNSTCYTLRYAAPELVSGAGSLHTLATDVWAWGCLLLAITTDLIPYATRASNLTVTNAVNQRELPADASRIAVPSFIVYILQKCWQQDPKARPDITRYLQILTTGNICPPGAGDARPSTESDYDLISDLDENTSRPSSAHPTTGHAGESAEENDALTFRSTSTGFAFDNAEVFDAPDFID